MTYIAPAIPATASVFRRPSAILTFCRQQPLGAISFVVIFVMMFAGLLPQFVAPYDPLDIDFAQILGAPSWEHWFGTDAFGRDIFSRFIWGSRTALVIASPHVLGSGLGAVSIASATGGRMDNRTQRFVDAPLASIIAGAGAGGAPQDRRLASTWNSSSPSPSRSCRGSRAWCAPPRSR
jgi:peptide/nickel transport system permease protein